MPKKMRGTRGQKFVSLLLPMIFFGGCGYSQDAWDQKVRQNEELRERLAAAERSRSQAENDYADALEEITQLEASLDEKGLERSGSGLDTTRLALELYEQKQVEFRDAEARFVVLKSQLAPLVEMGVEVIVRRNRITVVLPSDALFITNDVELKQEGKEALLQIAQLIRTEPLLSLRNYQIAGHTDDRFFQHERAEDSYELSFKRAHQALLLLAQPTEEGGGGILRERLNAAGFGASDPIADNRTEAGRHQNRRIEVVLVSTAAERLDLSELDPAHKPSASQEDEPANETPSNN